MVPFEATSRKCKSHKKALRVQHMQMAFAIYGYLWTVTLATALLKNWYLQGVQEWLYCKYWGPIVLLPSSSVGKGSKIHSDRTKGAYTASCYILFCHLTIMFNGMSSCLPFYLKLHHLHNPILHSPRWEKVFFVSSSHRLQARREQLSWVCSCETVSSDNQD